MAGQVLSVAWLVLLGVSMVLNASPSDATMADKQQPKTVAPKSAPEFSEADAARLIAAIQHALESDNQNRFLKLFDASKMANFATFRGEVAEFFENYEAFRFRYHLTETSREDEVGIVLADVEMELTPSGAYVPNVRRNAQLRLVAAWDGKAWKIVDWSPLAILR